jgi:hypothetical protein
VIRLKAAACAVLLALPWVAGTVRADDAHADANADASKTVSCLALMRIRSSEILDRSHMVFTMNDGSMYLNTLPYPCPGLRRGTPYMHRTSLGEICDLDIITVLNQVGGGFMPGASCGLGKFEAVQQADVDALKQQAKAAAVKP